MPSRLHWTGANEIAKRMRRIAKEMPDVLLKASIAEANIELTEMRRRTPVEFGPLRASLTMTAKREGTQVTIEFGAGGPSAPYAIYVHERTELFHRIGEAKFIERPLKEAAPHWNERIARRINLSRMNRV
jgi:hypothetical protein